MTEPSPRQYAIDLIKEIAGMEIYFIYVDSEGSSIGSGNMTINSAKNIANKIIDVALAEAYKQGTTISLIRQEYLLKVKEEIEKKYLIG